MSKNPSRLLSFVIPVRNEEHNLERAVGSILNQVLPGDAKIEIIIAVGPSEDRSAAVAAELAKSFAEVSVVENPTGITSSGLNLAIAKSSGEIVFRVDGHSALEPGYVAAALECLDANPKIGNVGGLMKASGRTDFERAVAWAYSSPFGLGGGNFHTGGAAGPAQTVYLGAFRRAALVGAGLFDEQVIRGQDWELNQRLAKEGWIIWFEPRMVALYRPRGSARELAKQFFKTGKWRGVLSRPQLPNVSLRYLAPPLLVLASLLVLPLWLYLASIVVIALTSREAAGVKVNLLAVLPTMHYCWGVGFLVGILSRRGR